MTRRSWAINSLRGLQAFRHASLRLLEDLLAAAGTEPLLSGDPGAYIEAARRASFSLYWSIEPGARSAAEAPQAHEVCLCSAPNAAAPLEALGHLLAYSIAEQLDEPAAVIDLGPGGTLSAWHGGSFVGPQVLPENTDTAAILQEIDRLLPGKRSFMHLVYVVRRPRAMPELRERFHRIVHVTHRPELAGVPAHLRGLLRPAVWAASTGAAVPLFCSFVATQFLGEDSAAPPSDWAAGLLAACRALAAPSSLRTQPVGEIHDAQESAAWRLRRDGVRLAVDLIEVERAWREWSREAAPPPFEALLFGRRPSYRASFGRWARAVTNRRVGLALSAPGASAYRLVPIVRAFVEEFDIPIDVVVGAGGGAPLAAAYAAAGLVGLEAAVAGSQMLPLLGLGTLASPALARAAVDWSLGAARVERLETRCVLLTVALGESPGPHAIVAGTLGEAVSASGCAATCVRTGRVGWRRFTNGMGAAGSAARALREHGADIVFALSCLPRPASGSLSPGPPWRKMLLSALAPVGRLVDAWTGSGILARQASRAAEVDAHVYMELPAGPSSLLEQLSDAATLVEEAERELATGELAAEAARCAAAWERFRSGHVRPGAALR